MLHNFIIVRSCLSLYCSRPACISSLYSCFSNVHVCLHTAHVRHVFHHCGHICLHTADARHAFYHCVHVCLYYSRPVCISPLCWCRSLMFKSVFILLTSGMHFIIVFMSVSNVHVCLYTSHVWHAFYYCIHVCLWCSCLSLYSSCPACISSLCWCLSLMFMSGSILLMSGIYFIIVFMSVSNVHVYLYTSHVRRAFHHCVHVCL